MTARGMWKRRKRPRKKVSYRSQPPRKSRKRGGVKEEKKIESQAGARGSLAGSVMEPALNTSLEKNLLADGKGLSDLTA